MQHTAYTDPQQLTLPIEFAPSVVRAHGLSVAHPRPLVSYGKDYGRVFCFRTSPRKAWRYAEAEYANAGSSYGALALDCDDADAYARGFLRSEIPPPNWRVFRPDTGWSARRGSTRARRDMPSPGPCSRMPRAASTTGLTRPSKNASWH